MTNVTVPAVRLRVFGGLRMWRSGAEVDLGPPRPRIMLAALVAARGNVVSLAELIDTVWGEEPSPTAVNQVHRLIGRIRRLFEPELPARAAGSWLHPAGDGYRLALDPGRCDLISFLELVRQARAAVRAGATAEAADRFRRALTMAGEPLFSGLDRAVLARPAFRALERERINAAADAADLAIADPGAARYVPSIQRIAASAPLDERLQARVIRLLVADDRRAEALELFDRTSRRLADELGADPGAELRAARGEADGPPRARPAQLPAPIAGFTPRPELTAVLDEQFAETAAGGTVVITAISGPAGIGKTALALDWAHRVADKFPDGQVYLDLGGCDPADALRRVLRAIGAGASIAGADLDTLAARYRSALADRRMIILLDDARDSEQIRPLLPGTPGCLIIVTSRSALVSLVAREGARSVPLDRPARTGHQAVH